jgi:chromosome segregation ATPase
MGWLELIPLLKRLLPLLARVAPMLEAFVVARATNSKEAEARVERVTADLKGDFKSEFALAAENHAAINRTLAEQTEHLRALSDDVQSLGLARHEHDARMETLESQIAGLARSLKTFAVATLVLLIVCVTLLATLFFRH